MEQFATFHDYGDRKSDATKDEVGLASLTFQDQEVVLIAFAEGDKFDDIWVVGSPHDLNLLENVGSLKNVEARSAW